MGSCEFVSFITSIACLVSKDKTIDEISLLAAFFTQLGDTLATIALTTPDTQSNNNSDDGHYIR